MRLVIDIPDKDYEFVRDIFVISGGRMSYKGVQANVINAIKQGTPYNPTGDLISREALIQAVEQGEGISWKNHGKDDLCVRKKYIDNAPTVCGNNPKWCESCVSKGKCASTRPHGEWYYNCQNGWHCSICHESVKDMPTVMRKADFNFCPNCGADMRGKE